MITLILARGGSKGIPKKNLKLLADKPLIWYVINAAKKSKKITQIFVSTDDDKIAEYVSSLDIEVIERPKEFAQDNSLDVDSFRHFCTKLNVRTPIVHLRATSPTIQSNILDDAIDIFFENEAKITSLRSAHETSESVFKYYVNEDEYWKPIVKDIDTNNPRQSYIKTYCPNGYIDIVKPDIFMNQESFYGNKIFAYKTEKIHEIDNHSDFHYVEYLIKNKIYVPI